MSDLEKSERDFLIQSFRELEAYADVIFIDTGASDAFTELYRSFTGEDRDFGTVLLVSKRVVLSASFAGDLAAFHGGELLCADLAADPAAFAAQFTKGV